MNRLEGKVAFISGGARGQGRSHAIRLAEEGADIVTFDLCQQMDVVEYPMSTPEDLDETVKLVGETGRRIIARQVDVRDMEQVQALHDDAIREFGHVDIVVANAGIMPTKGPKSENFASFYDCLDVMLSGVFHTIEAAAPHMIERGEGGSIVITSSTAGLRGMTVSRFIATPGMMGYHAAKHGVVGLMRCYANALASHNIRCNTIHPTGVNTPMVVNEWFSNFVEDHPELKGAFTNPLPCDLLDPADISNAIIYLASDEGRFITGTTMPVDAGISNKAG
jgi:SDR family mycofactocin-dependent oxidoreductase